MENLKKKIQLLLNLYKLKNFSEAELLCKKLISSHPQVVNLYNVLGLIFTEQKKINEAIIHYERGIKIDPNNAIIYNSIIWINFNSSFIVYYGLVYFFLFSKN